MKVFLNKTVHCEFDKVSDTDWSAIDGVCVEMVPGAGVAIQHTVGDVVQVDYIQDARISNFKMVVS